MLRLLFVSHSLPPRDEELANVGGMQRVAADLFDALDRRDDVHLHGYVLRSSWAMIHWKVPPFLLGGLLWLPAIARRQGTDVILFSSMVTASLAVPLARRLRQHGVRLAAIVHGLDVTTEVEIYQRFVPKVFDALDLVLPVSHATAEACLDRGLPRKKVHVVPNGIRLDRFPPLTSKRDMRSELAGVLHDSFFPLSGASMLLCSVGRQVKRKGISWFVDQVMPRLPDDIHYWVAGDEGPDTDDIRAAIDRHALRERARLLGKISEEHLALLYRGSDLFVMPNVPVPGDMEGFGVVMLEAGACGLPVVASRLEGIVDVIAEGRNGHLAESGDAEGFARAIMAYYRKPEGLSLASKRALRYTAERFGWEATAERYMEALKRLVR